MTREWFKKIKDSVLAIVPIFAIVLLLHFTGIAPLSSTEFLPFIFSSVCMVVGILLFTMGADSAITTMGDHVGTTLTKRGNIKAIILVTFALGTLVAMAEPDVIFLSKEVPVNAWIFIILIGAGVGLFLVAGLLRIIFKKSYVGFLLLSYGLIFAICALYVQNTDNLSYISLAFDGGGVAAGSLTVPFIMAIGASVASTRGGNKKQENSFGLVGLASIGPIIMLLLFGLFGPSGSSYPIAATPTFLQVVFLTFKNVSIALFPIAGFFFIYEIIFIKLPMRQVIKIIIGVLYAFVGLVIFLAAISYGFSPVAKTIGLAIGNIALDVNAKWMIIAIGAVLGFVAAIAEPAVYVLNKQVEDITGGMITRRRMLIGIAIGISLSVALSMIRVIYDINILCFLVPGYLLAIALTFVVPNIYTVVAFDSGGCASGTMTATFILPFAIGVCMALFPGQDALIGQNAFGMVAMVTMTPVIVVQLLGFTALMKERAHLKAIRSHVKVAYDDQIIDFI